GAVYMLSALLPLEALPRLLLLMAGRLVLGFGESQLVIGALAWGIGLVGQPRTGRVLSWMGMAMYGALAAGAPAGLWLSGLDGT
ncbi:arabinose transporter, partial [Klebsiella pneumoniae]|nr:arabinose transporter [Klebsiella pneumoniae]